MHTEEYETEDCQNLDVSKKLIPTPGDDKLPPRVNHFKSCVLPFTQKCKTCLGRKQLEIFLSKCVDQCDNCVFHLHAVDTQDTANNVINFLQLPHKGFICTRGIKRLRQQPQDHSAASIDINNYPQRHRGREKSHLLNILTFFVVQQGLCHDLRLKSTVVLLKRKVFHNLHISVTLGVMRSQAAFKCGVPCRKLTSSLPRKQKIRIFHYP